MNRIIVYLLLLVSSTIFAQESFAKLEKDGIESLVANKKMLEMMSKVKVDTKDKEAQKYFLLLKKLDVVEAYYTSKPKFSAEINNTASGYLKTNALPEIITKTENGNVLKVYGKIDASETNFKEVLVVVNGDFAGIKTMLLSVKGDFPLSELSLILKKLDIPGSDILDNLKK